MRIGAESAVVSTSLPLVTADVFERASGIPAALQGLGARVEIEPLAAGDYRVGRDVLVERKTVADLHGSLGRGRLWDQIGKIRDEAASPFLLVEGEQLDAGPRHPNAVRGALLAIVELGVAILWTRDPVDSALWLHRLAVRHLRKSTARRELRQASECVPPGIEVLTAVPGVSAQTARALLRRFGSVQGLLAAGPERWAEVAGVGPVRAHALSTAFLNGATRPEA